MTRAVMVSDQALNELIDRARASSRRRAHLNLHGSPNEPCQRLLNAMEPDSYIPPHRHSDYDTNETLLALRGRFRLLVFDDEGVVVQAEDFAPGTGLCELLPSCWHTVLSLETGGVMFETKSGPYLPERAKVFAPWAPQENDPSAGAYLGRLRTEVG